MLFARRGAGEGGGGGPGGAGGVGDGGRGRRGSGTGKTFGDRRNLGALIANS